MFIKNTWYVAGWSKEVPQDGFLARTILGLPLALWRDQAGKVVAFEDMCCHRGAPLSRGRREGDTVRCLYHGLLFDRAGKCIEVPSQDSVPANACVRTFPVVERHRWIWIWMGDVAKADPALIPDTHWLDDPGWRSLEGGYTHYDTNYLLICDNLLDLAHLPYVHPTTLGGSEDYARNPATVEMMERGLKVTRWALNTAPPPFIQKVRPFDGLVDRWNVYDFLIPGLFLMDSGIMPAGTGAQQGNRENAAQFHSCQALTPESETSTHYFYAQPHNFALDRPEVTASIHQSIVQAFEEDRAMITAQAQNLAKRPDFRMTAIRADLALSRYRWLVERTLAEEAKAGAAPLATAAE
jgi:phenylpropionate dioxygenase-like ring-hydroxylating dioxygenase large terminal subunit